MKKIITNRNVKAIQDVIVQMNNLRRWRQFINDASFNELAKQALNLIITFILVCYYEHENNEELDWTCIPKIALHRAFEKISVYCDTPTYIYQEITEVSDGQISQHHFTEYTRNSIVDEADCQFYTFIHEGKGTTEERIFQAATKVATLVELIDINIADRDVYVSKIYSIAQEIKQFEVEFPFINDVSNPDSKIFKMLRQISHLRNQNRWAKQSYQVDCSVLSHLYDTAIWAYIMGLEEENETTATNLFFCGIFHDVPEAWTMDIPSPIKDGIPGFRKATEIFEAKCISKYVLDVVPNFVGENIAKTMEYMDSNSAYHALMKGADYLSADSECWRQYEAGSKSIYFYEAMRRTNKKLHEKKAEKKIAMSPIGKKFHKAFMKSSSKVRKLKLDVN